MAHKRRIDAYCAVLAFVGGFHVMLLEMCAFRILPTHFGSSIYTTGILLTLIMVALSAGYYLGGHMSDRVGRLDYLLLSLFVAVAYVNVTNVLMADWFLDRLFDYRSRLDSGLYRNIGPPGIVTLVFYGFPMIALSQISPYLIKFATVSRSRGSESRSDTVGRVAGRYMALSTAGSILGTLLSSFVFIPNFGVRATLAIFSVSTLCIIILGCFLLRSLRRAGVGVAAAIPFVSLLVFFAEPRVSEGILFETESMYGNVQVVETVERGRRKVVFRPSRVYAHSQMYPDDPLRNRVAMDFVDIAVSSGARSFLILGSAGGTVIRLLAELNPEYSVVGVDIDRATIEIAERFFGVVQSEKVKLFESDARMYLEDHPKKYDYIAVDLFQGEFVPLHCTTTEFFRLVYERLEDDGMMFVNTNRPTLRDLLEVGEQPFRNLAAAFYAAGFQTVLKKESVWNGHVVAFKRSTAVEDLRRRLLAVVRDPEQSVFLRAALAGSYLQLVPVPDERPVVPPFTDAWAPEPLLQRKTALRRTLLEAREHRESISTSRLGAVSAAYLTSFAENDRANAPNAKRAAGDRHCDEIFAEVAKTTLHVSTLATSMPWWTCSDHLSQIRHSGNANLRVLRWYLKGFNWLNQNDQEKALRDLTQAIDFLEKRQREQP